MAIQVNPLLVYDLKRELNQVRRESLLASRAGDFLRVAQLTARAAELNKRLLAAEGQSYAMRLP
ncbi:MAG TPA: hypothetical protein VEH27_03665 [Methylomirabilota bacterium]|nr:hypothetical protein [Methylomirabilota bacterium]